MSVKHPGHPDQSVHGRRRGGIRKALANAADIDQLATAASREAKRITGRDITFDFTGTDLQIGREHGEGILKGLERFPGARLGFVGTYGPGSTQTDTARDLQVTQAGSAAVTRSHGVSEGGKFVLIGNVYFNNAYAGNPDRYREDFEPDAGGGPRRVVTSGPRGVALHEFGHVVAATDGAMAREAYGDAVIHAEELRRDPRSLIAKEVSAYASTSPGEFAAEAFADVMEHGDAASELSRLAFELMEARYAEAVS